MLEHILWERSLSLLRRYMFFLVPTCFFLKISWSYLSMEYCFSYLTQKPFLLRVLWVHYANQTHYIDLPCAKVFLCSSSHFSHTNPPFMHFYFQNTKEINDNNIAAHVAHVRCLIVPRASTMGFCVCVYVCVWSTTKEQITMQLSDVPSPSASKKKIKVTCCLTMTLANKGQKG